MLRSQFRRKRKLFGVRVTVTCNQIVQNFQKPFLALIQVVRRLSNVGSFFSANNLSESGIYSYFIFIMVFLKNGINHEKIG